MRTILLSALLCGGCFDYESLSSGFADGATDDAGEGADGGTLPDGAMAAVDFAGLDLTGVDLADAPPDLAPPPPDMTCATYTHTNGLGKSWVDCVPVGTHTATQAMKACLASFAAASCIYPPSGAGCSGKAIAGNSGSGWTFFVYYGTFIGKTVMPGNDCTLAGSPTSWD